MHSALRIPEIFLLISKDLDREDLLILSRCCQALYPAATDAIWETIRSPWPLLNFLPYDIWNQDMVRSLQLHGWRRC